MTAHAKLSPSKRHRWANCPGSVREEAKYPDEPAGPAAIDGTHSHTLLETCIKGGYDNVSELVGQSLTDHEGEFVVDAERAGRVQVAIDYINLRVKELGGLVRVKSESKVDPSHLLGRSDMSGTVDVQLISDDEIEIIDYKDGMNFVPAENNEQLEVYAMGVLAEMGLPINQYPNKNVRLTIIQPKMAFKGINPISYVQKSTMDIIRMIGKMVREASATDAPNAPLIPGEKQCKYCAHKGSCSALVQQVFDKVDVMHSSVATDAANKDPHTMTDEQLVEILESAPLLRSMLDAAEAEAQKRLENGKTISGIKLVRGRGSRTWAFSEDEIADKLQRMGMPKSAIWETKIISASQAEKVTWESKGEVKKLSERQIKTLQNEYVKKSEGKLTVALASDPRESVIVDASPMFGDTSLPSWLS